MVRKWGHAGTGKLNRNACKMGKGHWNLHKGKGKGKGRQPKWPLVRRVFFFLIIYVEPQNEKLAKAIWVSYFEVPKRTIRTSKYDTNVTLARKRSWPKLRRKNWLK